MSDFASREAKMSDVFLFLGSQYFSLARFSAQLFFMPITAILYHHAIEMLIKGFLVRCHTSAQLKKVGHNLQDLWERFKASQLNTNLSRFDSTIARLDSVEHIRYPDAIVDEGYKLSIRLGPEDSQLDFPGTEDLPSYHVNVSDLDEITLLIFEVCEVTPAAYFRTVPEELKATLPAVFVPS